MARRIQLRRDSAADWLSANPILAEGEEGLELDTGKRKIGDGSTAWAGLDYMASSGSTIYRLVEGVDFDFAAGVTIAEPDVGFGMVYDGLGVATFGHLNVPTVGPSGTIVLTLSPEWRAVYGSPSGLPHTIVGPVIAYRSPFLGTTSFLSLWSEADRMALYPEFGPTDGDSTNVWFSGSRWVPVAAEGSW